MTPSFALIALVLAWVLLPLALLPFLKRTALPAASTALAVMAGVVCVLVALEGTGPLIVQTSQPAAGSAHYHDTYYIVALQRWLEQTAFLLLGLGGLALIAQGLGAARWLSRGALAGHWAVHLGAALVVLPSLPLAPMPRRYVDYPDAFVWKTVLANAGAGLCLTGAGMIAATIPLSLMRKVVRR